MTGNLFKLIEGSFKKVFASRNFELKLVRRNNYFIYRKWYLEKPNEDQTEEQLRIQIMKLHGYFLIKSTVRTETEKIYDSYILYTIYISVSTVIEPLKEISNLCVRIMRISSTNVKLKKIIKTR